MTQNSTWQLWEVQIIITCRIKKSLHVICCTTCHVSSHFTNHWWTKWHDSVCHVNQATNVAPFSKQSQAIDKSIQWTLKVLFHAQTQSHSQKWDICYDLHKQFHWYNTQQAIVPHSPLIRIIMLSHQEFLLTLRSSPRGPFWDHMKWNIVWPTYCTTCSHSVQHPTSRVWKIDKLLSRKH